MKPKSILIFGAGKIGRSFIGQLFGLAGYEVIFVDVNRELVDLLNARKSYPVIIKSDEGDQRMDVPHVRAVHGRDKQKVVAEIVDAGILAVSVGKNVLDEVLPVVAEGIRRRYQKYPDHPLDIILAENMRSAAGFVRPKLQKYLPADFPIHSYVGLVETSIGKMVPIMTLEDLQPDRLAVFAESYNTLILDGRGFCGSIPEVAGLAPKENIQAWVDRKAFLHNLGHATTAYLSSYYHPSFRFIYEALVDRELFIFVKKVMSQAANVLLEIYPEAFSADELKDHIDDLLHRFQNKALKDTVFRVGQDLPRKLGIDDRFMAAVLFANEQKLPNDLILEAMCYGFFFYQKNNLNELSSSDRAFLASLKNGIKPTLVAFCQFDPNKHLELIQQLESCYEKLKSHSNEPTSISLQSVKNVT